MKSTKPTHVHTMVETMGGDWVGCWAPVTKVEIIDGIYEVSPISADWDKDPGFNETAYLHMLNLGYAVQESYPSQKVDK